MHVLVRSREIVLFRVYSYFPCRPELILAKVDVWLYLQLFQIQKEKRGQSAWFVHTPPSLRLATPSVYPPIRDQLSPESHVLNIVLRPDCQQVRSPLIALSLVTFLTSTCLGKSY